MVTLSPLRRFVVGESISIFGSQMALIIIPLLAVEVLAASEWQLGVLTAIEYIPFVVLGLLFGAIIDATSVRNTLLLSNFGRLILLAILGLLVIFTGLSRWLLICIVFLLCTLSTFFDLAVQSAVPFMTPKGM